MASGDIKQALTRTFAHKSKLTQSNMRVHRTNPFTRIFTTINNYLLILCNSQQQRQPATNNIIISVTIFIHTLSLNLQKDLNIRAGHSSNMCKKYFFSSCLLFIYKARFMFLNCISIRISDTYTHTLTHTLKHRHFISFCNL